MTEHILKPLGLSSSTYDINELSEWDDVSVPYVYNKKTQQLDEQPWPSLGNYEVGGGVRSSVLDLLKYGQAYLTDRLINARTAAAMYQPAYAIGRNTSYGYALKRIRPAASPGQPLWG